MKIEYHYKPNNSAMTKDSNYNELALIMGDIETLSIQHPTYWIFNREKIKKFQDNNEVRIGILHKQKDALVKKFAKLDDSGNPIIIIANGIQQLSWETEENKAEFEKEWKTLMAMPIQLFI
jgi:hypothetical protein